RELLQRPTELHVRALSAGLSAHLQLRAAAPRLLRRGVLREPRQPVRPQVLVRHRAAVHGDRTNAGAPSHVGHGEGALSMTPAPQRASFTTRVVAVPAAPLNRTQ